MFLTNIIRDDLALVFDFVFWLGFDILKNKYFITKNKKVTKYEEGREGGQVNIKKNIRS